MQLQLNVNSFDEDYDGVNIIYGSKVKKINICRLMGKLRIKRTTNNITKYRYKIDK